MLGTQYIDMSSPCFMSWQVLKTTGSQNSDSDRLVLRNIQLWLLVIKTSCWCHYNSPMFSAISGNVHICIATALLLKSFSFLFTAFSDFLSGIWINIPRFADNVPPNLWNGELWETSAQNGLQSLYCKVLMNSIECPH